MDIDSRLVDYKTRKALVIDDYPSMRAAFKTALASFGMTKVDLAASGSEAVMRVKGTRYDIIISDYNLGEGRDGQQVLEELRHRGLIGIETAFLMVTAESVYERVVAAAELAPDDYLIKPFNGEILRTRLDAILLKKEAFRAVYRAFADGDLERAAQGCDDLMKSHPKYAIDAMRFKGEVLVAMGEFEAAEALYKQVMALRAVPWSRLGLARTLHLQRKEAPAEMLLNDIVAQFPEMVAGYDLLADVQMAQNKTRDAQRTLHRGVALSGKSMRRQRRLGEVAYQNGDLRMAEQAFDATINKGRNSIFLAANDFANLARVHIVQGDTAAAADVVQANRKLLQESDDGKLVAAVVMGQVHARAGRVAEAEQQARKALDLKRAGARGEPELLLDLAEACERSGLGGEAEELLAEVVRNAHDSTALIDKAKRIYREAGKEALAEQAIRAATEAVARLAKEGALLMQRGDLRGGVSRLTQAATEAPRNPRVLMNAVWAILRLVEQEGADDAGLMTQARRLLDDAAWLAPDHYRLNGLQTQMRKLTQTLHTGRLAALGGHS